MEAVPGRVVSLVPSVTESLFVLGLGDSLVGITDYCIYPADRVSALPKIGGTKNPHVPHILELKPDLVIANQEENTPETVEALRTAGIRVLVQFPRSVDDAVEGLYDLAGLFRNQPAMLAVESLARSVDYARGASQSRPALRYFCPIWLAESDPAGEWWMTFNRDTYPHDLLEILGGENVFGWRERRYPLAADLGRTEPAEPGGRDVRYPRLTTEEVIAADPQAILLPSEPFAFEERHAALVSERLRDTTAVQNRRVHLVDGSLVTWHGVRLAQALRVLPGVLSP